MWFPRENEVKQLESERCVLPGKEEGERSEANAITQVFYQNHISSRTCPGTRCRVATFTAGGHVDLLACYQCLAVRSYFDRGCLFSFCLEAAAQCFIQHCLSMILGRRLVLVLEVVREKQLHQKVFEGLARGPPGKKLTR